MHLVVIGFVQDCMILAKSTKANHYTSIKRAICMTVLSIL